MSARRKTSDDVAAQPWAGPERRYDIVKEFVIALVVMSVLADDPRGRLQLAGREGPDLQGVGRHRGRQPLRDHRRRARRHARSRPATARPYNDAGEGIAVGPLKPQKWMGVRIPVDPANDFVITPLKSQEQPAAVATALQAWEAATPEQRQAWAAALDDGDPGDGGCRRRTPPGPGRCR